MTPFIRNGDIAVIKKTKANDIHIGDIVLYHIGEDFFAHRVFKKGTRSGNVDRQDACPTFTLKADAVTGLDRDVSFEEVVGKVISIERGSYILDLQARKWRIINYFILLYSLGLSILRERLRIVRNKIW